MVVDLLIKFSKSSAILGYSNKIYQHVRVQACINTQGGYILLYTSYFKTRDLYI